MRALFWFSIGAALSCCVGLWLLWDAVPLLLAGALLLAGSLAVLSRRFRWLRRAAAAALGLLLGSCLLLTLQRTYYEPLLALDEQTLPIVLTAKADSVPGLYSQSVRAEMKIGGKCYCVQAYLGDGQTAQAGNILRGDFRIRVTLPGGSKQNAVSFGRGIFAQLSTKGAVAIEAGQENRLRYLPQRLGARAKEAVEACFPEDTEAFAKSLLLGDTSELSYSEETALRISGIRHIVAVSGLHVAILFGFLWVLCARRPWPAFLLGVPLLVLFGTMVGNTPSVVRACLMAALLILARLTRRSYDSLTAWAFAVLWLLLGNPLVVAAAGFQLSVLCVLGILLFQRSIAEGLSRLFEKLPGGKVLSDSLAVSLSATVLSLPVSVYYFGTASLIGPVTNFCILWLLPFVFGGILAVSILGPVFPVLGTALGWLTAWPIRLVLRIAGTLSRLPMAAVYTCNPYVVYWLMGVYVLILAWFLLGRKRGWVFVSVGAASLALITALWSYGPRVDNCRLTVLDVGEGQTLLLQSGGQSALIDCGGYSDTVCADRAWQMLRSQNLYDLDLLLFTHFDRDHFGGTENFLTQIPAERVILPGISELLPLGQVVTEDCAVPFGKGILHIYPYSGGNKEQENSMAILFETEDCGILITGDLDVAGERRLVKNHALGADILVVGHHGSKYATCPELLDAVQPELAVISVGENNYGHPTQELLDRLEEAGCTVRRTDQEGTIIIRR